MGGSSDSGNSGWEAISELNFDYYGQKYGGPIGGAIGRGLGESLLRRRGVWDNNVNSGNSPDYDNYTAMVITSVNKANGTIDH